MKKNMYVVMLAALAIAGCSNEMDEQAADGNGRVPLQISGDINMLMTRAADDHWDENDAIGIYMVNNENAVVEGVDNYRYVTNAADGTFAPDGSVAYFPENGDAVNVVAYYPQGSVNEGKLSLDLSNQDSQPQLDLMTAKVENISKDNPAVSLGFKHRLTKLFFEITGDVNTDGMYAAIGNQYTDIKYDVLGNKLSVSGEKKDIAMKYWNLDGYRFVEAIVLSNEGEITAEDRILTFRLPDGKECKAKIESGTTFTAGKKYKYNITFTETSGSGTNATIQGAGITNWEDVTDDSETTVNPEEAAITKVYFTGAPTGWGTWVQMTKSNDNIFTWTGNIMKDAPFKFTLEETYDVGTYQLMSSIEAGASPVTLTEGTESDVFKVLYQSNGVDTQWVVGENGTYTVTLNTTTMKISIEKIIYILGVNGSYDQGTAPQLTKNDDGNYEITIEFTQACKFKLPLWLSDSWDMDYYMPAENVTGDTAPLVVGTAMKANKQNNPDHQWSVAEEQLGTYQLTVNVSDLNNVTLTATKIEQPAE